MWEKFLSVCSLVVCIAYRRDTVSRLGVYEAGEGVLNH